MLGDVVCWLWVALMRLRRAADPRRMSADHDTRHTVQLHAQREASIKRCAQEQLRTGTIAAFLALPHGRRLVEVLAFDPAIGLEGIDVYSNGELHLTPKQVYGGWQLVRFAPAPVPNALSDADIDALRARANDRG